MIIYGLCLKKIHQFLHFREFTQRHIDERIVRTISCNVCAFSLTTAIIFISILPLSMISNELILATQTSKAHWYLQWLSTELFSTLWKCISICSIVSNFVLLQ